jgi:co-chaperonin GroES (HSP10)
MSSTYDVKQLKIRAIHDNVLVSDMDFGEIKTSSGIVLRSDDGKSHGIKPRWGKVYKVGPEQKDVTVGQWILIEHGRWSRKIRIDDGDSIKDIQKVDVTAILAVSDDAPSVDDVLVKDSI